MKIRMRFPDYAVVAGELATTYLKLCFWLSWIIPFGVVKIYELIKPYIIN